MSEIRDGLRYAASHEWVLLEGETGCVGITDHAQHELTDVVFVELPKVGRTVKAGEAVAVVESVKAASDIYSPLSGTVTAVNEALSADPALVNTSPYDRGWIYKLTVTAPDEVTKLHDAAAYRTLLGH